MTGAMIRVISRRRYDFTSGYALVPIHPVINVESQRLGVLLVRLHKTSLAGFATLKVALAPVSTSAEDPAVDFIDGSTDVASVFLDASAAAPGLFTEAFIGNFGPQLGLWVEGSPSMGTCIATISVDLALND